MWKVFKCVYIVISKLGIINMMKVNVRVIDWSARFNRLLHEARGSDAAICRTETEIDAADVELGSRFDVEAS